MVQAKQVRPFFSIITCTKNSAKYLPDCLKSLDEQTFKDYEHIVIDGNSTDKTTSLISKKSRVYSLSPSGISAAMNLGIKHAKGKYLYFLHSDDQLASSLVLERAHAYLLDHSDLDWVYGQIIEFDSKEQQVGVFPRLTFFKHPYSWLLWFYNYIPHQAVFMKSSVFTQFGSFNAHYTVCMDYEYWLRIAKHTSWGFLPLKVARYRVHNHAVSADPINSTVIQTETIKLRLQHII